MPAYVKIAQSTGLVQNLGCPVPVIVFALSSSAGGGLGPIEHLGGRPAARSVSPVEVADGCRSRCTPAGFSPIGYGR